MNFLYKNEFLILGTKFLINENAGIFNIKN